MIRMNAEAELHGRSFASIASLEPLRVTMYGSATITSTAASRPPRRQRMATRSLKAGLSVDASFQDERSMCGMFAESSGQLPPSPQAFG